MEDPPFSPPKSPELPRVCPKCKRPVAPGYKFCEVCGTRIPSLYTCSKCGTQFVHLKKYCDACGALFVPKEIQEPEPPEEPATEDEVPEPETEEAVEPGEEEIPEQEPEEIPEPGGEEIPEPVVPKRLRRSGKKIPVQEPEEPEPEEAEEVAEEEIPVPAIKKRKKPAGKMPAAMPEEEPEQEEEQRPAPAEKKRKKQYGKEIREPPTEEILREFGEDEEEEEPAKKGRKGLFGFLGRKKEEQPVNPDEALFLADKAPARKKSRGSGLKIVIAVVVIVAILAAVYFFGLSALSGLFAGIIPSSAEVTPTPEPTVTPTVKPTTLPGALTTLPTETIPAGQNFDFSVQKHPVTQKISVIFVGSSGSGSDSIVRADIVVTHDDGSVSSGVILPLKGINEVPLNGSGTDRVVIIARMASGDQYRVYDKILSDTSGI